MINKNTDKSNKLIHESSPYLLQHAYNPVEWFPWGQEALSKAKNEDKPIFLSIGYSACHWCHVMAHESFEDENIADIMNSKFINIKVDREERPDLDDIYQKACQLASGNGGWPLSVFLTPDQKPFYVGTYFPKQSRYGIPGFANILETLSKAYKDKKGDIDKTTQEFMASLIESSSSLSKIQNIEIEKSILDESAVNLLQIADKVHGGFGQAPKFPNTTNLLFLLRYYDYSKNSHFLNFVEFTAKKMAKGGIHDHIGGGFSRYSTDERWLVPHFEKMLYDNALLIQLFAELYQATKRDYYLGLIKKTIGYLVREMTFFNGNNECAFYSAQDADSEGVEGKFYIWTKNEIKEKITDNQKFELFCDYFGITQGGNFEGKNILNITKSIESLSKQYNLSMDKVELVLNESLEILFKVRNTRIPPEKDEKILTSWNSLMISAIVSAYKVTDNPEYLNYAKKTINFIENKLLYDGNRLKHTHKDGISKLNGYLDDYSYYINSLLDVFEVTSNPFYLERAIQYTVAMINHFWDEKENCFFFTSDDHENLILRTKNFYDLAIPSGNSMAVYALLRLHFLTQNYDYLDKAELIVKSCYKAALGNPFGFGQLLISLYLYFIKPIEIIILQNKSDDHNNREIESWIMKEYIPNGLILTLKYPSEESQKLLSSDIFTILKGKKIDITDDNKAKECVYICKDFTCSLPMYSISDLKKYFNSNK
ncbi:MAG TPA: thioredoxin domain-containing protein [Nitrososphaeraceae archaeon]|nr:thioredoxin domain-containing protein [Nitrososphaeraceae archaeon]